MSVGLVVTVSTIAALGWVAAAAGWALWWGERGRRIDAQWRETGKPRLPGKPERASVRPPSGEGSHIPVEQDEQAIREKLVEDAVAEGFPRDLAEQDADEMLARIKADGPMGAPSW